MGAHLDGMRLIRAHEIRLKRDGEYVIAFLEDAEGKLEGAGLGEAIPRGADAEGSVSGVRPDSIEMDLSRFLR